MNIKSSKVIYVNNMTLHYDEKNESKKRTLLFLHGNSQNSSFFKNQLRAAKFNEYRLIFLDLPGHGSSSRSDEYSLKFFGSVVSNFIQILELTDVVLIGHSFGGHVALNSLATSSPLGILLFGTPPLTNPFDPASFLPNLNAKALMMTEASQEEVEALMDELKFESQERVEAIHSYRQTDPNFRVKVFENVGAGQHLDETRILKNYEGKIMLLVSNQENFVNNQYILDHANKLGISQNVSVINSGHSPHIECPDAFNNLVIDFCEEVFETQIFVTVLTKEAAMPSLQMSL